MSDEVKNEETQTEAAEEVKEETPAEAPKEEVKEEAPAEAPKEEAKEEKPEPSGKFKELITNIESLSALELAELVKELEERFGVSAAAPVAVAGAPAGGAAAAEAVEEKSAYTIVLSASGDKKINVIKAVREINPDLGLGEAKELVDSAPKEIKQNVPKDEAEEAKKKLEEAGATVELK